LAQLAAFGKGDRRGMYPKRDSGAIFSYIGDAINLTAFRVGEA